MDSVLLILGFLDVFDVYFVVFVTCELCQIITNKFEEIEEMNEQLDWYLYPDKMKQMLPTIFCMLQKPVIFECFGSFSSSRESFKKVSTKNQMLLFDIFSHFLPSFQIIKTSYSYITVLHKLLW